MAIVFVLGRVGNRLAAVDQRSVSVSVVIDGKIDENQLDLEEYDLTPGPSRERLAKKLGALAVGETRGHAAAIAIEDLILSNIAPSQGCASIDADDVRRAVRAYELLHPTPRSSPTRDICR